MYLINQENGYISGVVSGVDAAISNTTEEEYRTIKSMLEHAPDAPEGYYYRLRESLEWELCEIPVIEEEATEEDYQAALCEMGVSL